MSAPTTSSITAPEGRISGLDLIRGGAVALVLLRHAFPEQIGAAGIVGVVAFFTLSGYLITGLLKRDIVRWGKVRYGRFYRNRILRLYPPLALMLIGFTVLTLTIDPLRERATVLAAVAVGLFYLTDLPVPLGSKTLGHLWSLANEEQFYLIWPLLLTFGIRRGKLRAVVITSSALIVVALLVTFVIFQGHGSRFSKLPTSWCIAMVIGAAQQLWGSPLRRLSQRLRALAAGCGVVVILGLSALPAANDSILLYVVIGPSAALCTAAIIETLREWRQLPSPYLRPLLALGTVSYAAYLWNYPVVLWLGPQPLEPWRAVLSILITVAAAGVSYWTLERPIMLLRRRLDRAGDSSAPTETAAAR